MKISIEFLAQHAALTQGVGLADLSDRTRLELRGSDRVAFLHSFCTNDVKQLLAGRGCEAFVTSPQGKTLGHVLVFCQPERLLLDTSPGQAATLIAHFDKYLISEDVQFVDRTAELAEFLVTGAGAAEMLRRLIGTEPPVEMLASAHIRLADREVLLCRVEYAGPASFFLHVPRADWSLVKTALVEAGAIQCGAEPVEAARLEVGFPLFGRDITDDNLPQEVARDARAISFTKGCYLGQETVARIDAIGHVNRRLVGLKFSSENVPPAGTSLLAGEKPVGHVTSSAWSPLTTGPLAMAYVRRAHSAPTTVLTTPFGPATVVSWPVQGS
jgi:tRNA-modifying protein YgfZ